MRLCCRFNFYLVQFLCCLYYKYNVIDIDPKLENGKVLSLKQLQRDLTMTDGVLSSRLLFGTPGTGYARNVDGSYFV